MLIAGCGTFDRDEARVMVSRVGEKRIREAAQSLRSFKQGEVPTGSWPNTLRELEPKHIFVDVDGVRIAKYEFFVQEVGIYVVFTGSQPPKSDGNDPSFSHIAEGIYWYLIAG